MSTYFSNQQLQYFCELNKIPFDTFQDAFNTVYFPLIKSIESQFIEKRSKPYIVAINAPQGCGKSTLSELIRIVLTSVFQRNSIAISIDGFYKTYDERKRMARQLHPLFITRGAPGTHDISLAIDTFEQLTLSQADSTIQIPKFDKASDDRMVKTQWPSVSSPLDIIIFEGWCLASRPQPESALLTPINLLEKTDDKEGVWRSAVNQALAGQYQTLFSYIDDLVYLSAPSFDCVKQWRLEQEQKLIYRLRASNTSTTKTMNQLDLEKFMMHFERITLHNITDLPNRADWMIQLDHNRFPVMLKTLT